MKLVWIHFKYQINVKTLVFRSFFGLLLVFVLLYNAGIFVSREERIIYYNQYFIEYHNDSSFNIYIILLIIAAFLPYLGENYLSDSELYDYFMDNNNGEFDNCENFIDVWNLLDDNMKQQISKVANEFTLKYFKGNTNVDYTDYV